MATYFGAGDAVQGSRVIYQFGGVRPGTPSGAWFTGHMIRTGRAVVDRPLFANVNIPADVNRAQLTGRPHDEIRCSEARYTAGEAPDEPKRRFKKSGRHTGVEGVLPDASFQITKPLPGR